MPYGVLGSQADQTKKNFGVFSVNDVADLEKQGKFGGSLNLISDTTFSGVSYVDLLSIKESKYDVHFLTMDNLKHDSNSTSKLQVYESGVLETDSVYSFAVQYIEANGNNGHLVSSSDNATQGLDYNNNGGTSTDSAQFRFWFYNLGHSDKFSFWNQNALFDDGGILKSSYGGGCLPQGSVIDGLRFNFNSVNTSGRVKLYGVKEIL